MKKDYDPLLTKEYLSDDYDNLEFTLASGITNYDVRTNVTGAFTAHDLYTTINIRTDQNITIKLNSTSNNAITVTSNRPFELDNLIEIKEIYITNASGNTANIKIFGTRKGT